MSWTKKREALILGKIGRRAEHIELESPRGSCRGNRRLVPVGILPVTSIPRISSLLRFTEGRIPATPISAGVSFQAHEVVGRARVGNQEESGF